MLDHNADKDDNNFHAFIEMNEESHLYLVTSVTCGGTEHCTGALTGYHMDDKCGNCSLVGFLNFMSKSDIKLHTEHIMSDCVACGGDLLYCLS